jgi:hypothetical protein
MVWQSRRESLAGYSLAAGLLVASQSKPASAVGTVGVSSLIGDYKDFGGQKIATRLTQQVMGNEQVLVINSVDYDAADPAVFEMPAAIKALVEKKQ